MKTKSKLGKFIAIAAIVWVLLYIAFSFILNEFNASIWQHGERFGLIIAYAFGAGMVGLGVYGD